MEITAVSIISGVVVGKSELVNKVGRSDDTPTINGLQSRVSEQTAPFQVKDENACQCVVKTINPFSSLAVKPPLEIPSYCLVLDAPRTERGFAHQFVKHFGGCAGIV